MSRLYYDSLIRLQKKDLVAGQQSQTRGYLEKVAKLIPSEIIAGYLAMVGFVPLVQQKDAQPMIYWIVFFICLILVPIYLNSQADKNKPRLVHLILSTCAFVVWAYVITGNTLIPDYYDAAIASIILIAFSLASAVIPLSK